MPLHPLLQVRMYDNDLSSPTLIEDLTDRVSGLKISTALNGGFLMCSFRISVSLGEAWNYLSREGKRGHHFNRVVVNEEQRVIWEGRVMDIELQIEPDHQGLDITCVGYWASMQDQFYSDDAGTDWTGGSGHEIDDIVKEVLTDECPDISTDHTNIAAGSRDLAGIDFSKKEYPQDIINELTKNSDDDSSVWFFAIWEGRVPYLFKRAVTQVDHYVWLADLGSLKLNQSATGLRNAILPFVGDTEGTTQTNTTSLALYPRREHKVSLKTGTNANTQGDAATTAAEERGFPRQQQSFRVTGRIYNVVAGDAGSRLEEIPLWRVRAGDVIRIQDLVPATAASPTLDDVRTFYIMETEYEAGTNTLTVQPDRRRRSLPAIIAKIAKGADVSIS
tara:strand:+ start:534 stop:1703 length:1170 start_codon:yes stop_codon:yes gene_type:complete